MRHTEDGTDLNRSFAPDNQPSSYEERRAAEILRMIRDGGYDYVLDMHTSTTDVDRCLIVDGDAFNNDTGVRQIVAASPIERVVLFPDWVSSQGLIGHAPSSVSVEYFRPVADTKGVEETLLTIRGLVRGKSLVGPKERQLFHVTELIPKSNDPGEDARNFELCADGYYPVLFGENSYRRDPTKPYLGFAATRCTNIVL